MRRVASLAAMALALALAPAPAFGAVGADRPYVYLTPTFTPKLGVGMTILFASADDQGQGVNLRIYTATGDLQSSSTTSFFPHGTGTAILNGIGAPMHVEVWADSPGITFEVTYTDTGDAARKIPAGDIRVVGRVEREVPDAALALGPKLDAFQTNVTGLLGPIGTRVNQLATADALTGSVAGLSTEVTTLRGQVSKLRKQMTSLRKLIVKRLPKR
jgi:hypothetical protein